MRIEHPTATVKEWYTVTVYDVDGRTAYEVVKMKAENGIKYTIQETSEVYNNLDDVMAFISENGYR